MIYFNQVVFLLFLGLFAISLVFYFLSKNARAEALQADAMLSAAPGPAQG